MTFKWGLVFTEKIITPNQSPLAQFQIMKGSYHRQTAALMHWRQGLLTRLFWDPDTTAGPTSPLQKGIIIRHLQRLHYSLVLKKRLCILSGRKGSHRIPVTICDVSLGHEIQGRQHHKDKLCLPLIMPLFTGKCTCLKMNKYCRVGAMLFI